MKALSFSLLVPLGFTTLADGRLPRGKRPVTARRHAAKSGFSAAAQALATTSIARILTYSVRHAF